jgi:glycosyltransferase involved in cell wall biosynthesis
LGIGDDSLVFGVFGGLTPEKRVPQVLSAFTAVLPYAPNARLLLAGAPASHYDVAADVRRYGLQSLVTITGYLETDAALTDAVAAADVALNLRWPTAREMSGPWLRALAAGVPTVTIDLWHTGHVPSLDPRTWQPNGDVPGDAPVTIALDILDEDHSLRLAMRRLASDAALRRSLGAAGRAYWEREHSVERMLDDYRHLLPNAAARPAGPGLDASKGMRLPAHLVTDGDRLLLGVLRDFGLEGASIWSTL